MWGCKIAHEQTPRVRASHFETPHHILNINSPQCESHKRFKRFVCRRIYQTPLEGVRGGWGGVVAAEVCALHVRDSAWSVCVQEVAGLH